MRLAASRASMHMAISRTSPPPAARKTASPVPAPEEDLKPNRAAVSSVSGALSVGGNAQEGDLAGGGKPGPGADPIAAMPTGRAKQPQNEGAFHHRDDARGDDEEQKMGPHDRHIDAHADAHEEQREQKAAEGLDVG